MALKRALLGGVCTLAALGCAACGGGSSDESADATETVTLSAAPSTENHTTAAAESADPAGQSVTMVVADGARTLEDSSFASWLASGQISTTDGQTLTIASVESHYNPEDRTSWALVETTDGQWAPVFFQHGELLYFAPLYGEEPTVSRVDELTMEVSGDTGTAQVAFQEGTLTVDGMSTDVPQLNLRDRG